ncbi:TPA: stage VI sporulation protein F [bacterium]|jgi:predicted transcriptional regulator|nr:stage VI sporulation protein F [bacterium]
MSNNLFKQIEKKSKVKKEDLMNLAKSIQGKNLKDEDNLRKLIKDIAKMAGKEVSKEKEQKIIDAVKKDKVPKNLDKFVK